MVRKTNVISVAIVPTKENPVALVSANGVNAFAELGHLFQTISRNRRKVIERRSGVEPAQRAKRRLLDSVETPNSISGKKLGGILITERPYHRA